jgi:hypothetical protein
MEIKDIYEYLQQNKDSVKDYDKLMRHMGKKVKFLVKNKDGEEDEFEFAPLNYELYLKFTMLGKIMEKFKPEEGDENSLEMLDESTLKVLFDTLADSEVGRELGVGTLRTILDDLVNRRLLKCWEKGYYTHPENQSEVASIIAECPTIS